MTFEWSDYNFCPRVHSK